VLRILSFFLCLSLLIGCDTDVVYEKSNPVNTYGWHMTDSLRYIVNIDDSMQRFDLSLGVRHRDIYDYTNLYVKVITKLPTGEVKSEVISLPLCDESGKWLGKCAGDICFARILLLKRTYFPIKGSYAFYVMHEMRQDKLKNILDISLRLEKSAKKVYSQDEE
jgi:gliding motility-associated lipoprotein GldH